MHLNKTTEFTETFLIFKKPLFSSNSLCSLLIFLGNNQLYPCIKECTEKIIKNGQFFFYYQYISSAFSLRSAYFWLWLIAVSGLKEVFSGENS